MNDIPATLTILGCLWLFAILVMIGWIPRIVNYLAKLSKMRDLLLRKLPGTRSETVSMKLLRFAIAAWLKPGDAQSKLSGVAVIDGDGEIDNLMKDLYPRHRLATAAFLICMSGLAIATATFF